MRIAIFNPVYNIGSTGKITHNLATSFVRDGHNVSVYYFRGETPDGVDGHIITDGLTRAVSNVMERLTGLTGCFSFVSTKRAVKILKKEKPDIVYLGNMHGCYINIYRLYKKLKEWHVPTIQIMWDEYPMTGSCAFSFDCEKFKSNCRDCKRYKEYPKSWFFDTSSVLQRKKRNAYDMKNLAFVTVPYIAQRAKQAFVIGNRKIYELDEAIDQKNIYYPRKPYELRKELGIEENVRIFLNVCVYPSERKGGKYYLDLARKCLDIRDVVFIHVGFKGDPKECPSNFIPIGFENDQNKMAMYYSLADKFVCTSLAETQPNTCLEALSCGTPICGFDISGIPTCADYPYGEYVEPGNTDLLKNIIINTKKKDLDSIKAVREYAETRFSSEHYYQKLKEYGIELAVHVGKET